jgi:malonate-semialdehyde dehydrogenase (acetylating) / methylmalonate-semialdehyde dehydrogenase
MSTPSAAPDRAVSDIPLWIGGAAATPHSARRGEVSNPATGVVIRHVPYADAEDVDRAVRAAAAAFPAWRATTPLRRARILTRFRELLERHQEELARLVSEEHGKVFLDAMGSVQRGIEVVEFVTGAPHLLKGELAEQVGREVDAYSRLQPIGVCVGITPFNFPAMVPLWMFPVALVCGNTFVLKPSEKVPSASIRMAELLREAGLPDGVFNVIHGDKAAVDALLVHPDVRAVSFVGSTPVARHVYATAAAAGKRVQALGGAKNHAVVLPDADLDFTADALAGAAYGSAGERCMAISVAVAVGACADPLVAKLADKARRLRVGPGDMPGVDMGPLITRAHRDRVQGYVDAGVAEGAELVVDGRGLAIPGHESGFFLGPSLFDRVTPVMTIYQDEIFGPVLIVVRVDTLDDALTVLNQNPYGNGCAIFTRSGPAARRFEEEVEVGMVGINVPIPVPMSFFSFGGWKQSLFGDLHVHGIEGIRFYTRTKAVTSRWPRTDLDVNGFIMPTLG